jgi:soluble lytic murein transglycosylase
MVPLHVEIGPTLPGRNGRLAAEALAAGDPEEAARWFDRVLEQLTDREPPWYEAQLLSGLCHLRAGRADRALRRIEELAEIDHPLAPFARLQFARAKRDSGDPDGAAALLGGDWPAPYAEEALRLEVESLLAAKRAAEAATRLSAVRPGPVDGETAAWRLLRIRAALEATEADPGSGDDALAGRRRALLDDLRGLRAEAAGTDEEAEAQALLERFARRLRRTERAALLDRTVEERIARVKRLTARYRYDEAQQEAERLAESLAADDPLRCAACEAAGLAWFKARSYRASLPWLDRAMEACRGSERWVEAAWHAGRAHLNAGDAAAAAAAFEALEREAGDSPRADDARLERASIARDGGDDAAFVALLEDLTTRWPAGDQAPEAIWRLGWHALDRGDPAEAERRFGTLVRRDWQPAEAPQGGRARYWHAVALERSGREDQAREGYREVARRHPFTFYGILAHNRVRLRDPAAARALLGEAMVRRPAEPAPTTDVPDVPVFRSDGFRRTLAFLRMGLFAEAEAEVKALQAAEGIPPAAAEALAGLASRLGAWRLGRRLGGAGGAPLGRLPLDPDHLRTWELAYPRAWHEEVKAAAGKHGIPEALAYGILREESGFDPRAFSSAHAIGLMQLLLPTAQRFAGRAGIEGTLSRRRLARAGVNIAVGCGFLGFLAERYPERLVLVPAAYNAGEGRLDRWLDAHGDLPIDRFLETVPFDNTRTYLMRVVSSWTVYRALYAESPDEEIVPAFDPDAPARPARPEPAAAP